MFTKPITEYRDDRDRRIYEQSNVESSKIGDKKNDPRTESAAKPDDASTTTHESDTSSQRKAVSVGHLAGASGKSIAMFAPRALKGMTVDIPLAFTEGLKNVPRLYGDTPRDHGPVIGFKSGATVAGKTFAWGFIDGLSDVVVKPYQGAQKEGVKGAVKGFGKGVAGMTTKTGAGMFGLFGYTASGIAKSLRTAVYTKTRERISNARHAEGRWLTEKCNYGPIEFEKLRASFEAQKKKSD